MSASQVHNLSSLSVQDYVDLHASTKGDQVFLIDAVSGDAINFAQCQDKIKCIVSVLQSEGIKPGQAIGYAFANQKEGALIILALMYGGYLATAINLVAGESTLAYVLEHSEAVMVIVDDEGGKLLDPLLSKQDGMIKRLSMDELLEKASSVEGVASQVNAASQVNPTSDGLLMYTSGTTGRPKGVVHSHESLLAGGLNTVEAHALQTQDRGLCVLPFYHINAFCVSLMGSLVSGSSLVIPSRFSVSSFWNMLRKYQCTWFSVVPTQISYLLHDGEGTSDNCDKLRFGRSASAPLSPEMHSAFEERFNVPIIETMGLTETAAPILSNPLPPNTRKIGSPGIAYGNEVIIGDENQNPVEAGIEGEILVRGTNVLKGYLKNEDATREAITKDCWLRTGDLGRMDEDGFVFVTGRLKELIIKGGENIAPREVDEALYCCADVMEAAAFAVPCQDYGQRVEAGVKLGVGSQMGEEELLELCHERLGKFKSPDKIYILDDLPKGPSGKIQRIKLAEIINEQ